MAEKPNAINPETQNWRTDDKAFKKLCDNLFPTPVRERAMEASEIIPDEFIELTVIDED